MRPEMEAACWPLRHRSSYLLGQFDQSFQVGETHTDAIRIRRPAHNFLRDGAGGDDGRQGFPWGEYRQGGAQTGDRFEQRMCRMTVDCLLQPLIGVAVFRQILQPISHP